MLAPLAALAAGKFLGKDTPFEPRPAPFIALALAGLVIGTLGHIAGSRTAVVSGIAMIFAATLLLPLLLYLTHR